MTLTVNPLLHGTLSGQTGGADSVRTNLALYEALTDTFAEATIQAATLDHGIPVIISIKTEPDHWFVEEGISSALQRMGYPSYNDSAVVPPNAVKFEVMPVFSVSYDDVFRDGMFGTKRVHRNASAAFAYQIVEKGTGKIIAGGNSTKQYSDVIRMDDISSLENNGIRSTHAEVPTDSFFDRVVEPFVIIGAAGTAVYLFFHVRS